MKLEILQENLVRALQNVQKVVPSKPQLPILSSILLTAQNKTITLAATDLYVGMEAKTQGKIESSGRVAVPGNLFYHSISSLPPGKLKMELKGNTLHISSSHNETKIQCLPPAEFPDFPVVEGKEVELKNSFLEEVGQKVGLSASLDQTKPVLTALLFEFKQDDLLVVGTDGFRLSTLSLEAKKQVETATYLIPAKAIAEATALSKDDKEVIKFIISDELKQALFQIGETALFVRLIEGEYPPFNKIIPDDFSFVVTLDGKALTNQLKRAQVFAQKASNIIRLIFNSEKLQVVAKSPSHGQQVGELEYELIKSTIAQEEIKKEIAFNGKYLTDFMNSLKPEKINFYMNEKLTPVMVRPEGEDNYKHIIMPFRVNQ